MGDEFFGQPGTIFFSGSLAVKTAVYLLGMPRKLSR